MAGELKQAWKALPAPVRRVANQAAQGLGRATLPYTVARRWRVGAAGGEPVIVAGLHDAVVGLGQGARLFCGALEQDGVDLRRLDVAQTLAAPVELGRRAAQPTDLPTAGVVVSHLNPPELELYLQKTGAQLLAGRRHVGYWAWELPTAPPQWRRAFGYVDEVWCPSSFTAAALRAIAPRRVPVRVVPHPIFVTPTPRPDRTRFGLPNEACIVLQAFDLRSTVARKNPLGALDAYLRAVPDDDGSARLVCKVVGAEAFPTLFAELRTRVAARSDLILISETLSSQDMLALTASVDIILSLHRAEGFGLLLAEAMWLGKAVMATAYSGNMDFMDPQSAALIDWKPVAARDPQGMYAGALWAEPDLGAAAVALRRLIADPAAREGLGRRGQARARRYFDRDTWLRTVRGGLTRAQPGGAYPMSSGEA